jgi:hypothetical protein
MTSPLPATPTNADAGESLVKLATTLPASKQFPWYQASFGSRLTTECRQLLEEYSRIPPEEVEGHVYGMAVSRYRADRAEHNLLVPHVDCGPHETICQGKDPAYHGVG